MKRAPNGQSRVKPGAGQRTQRGVSKRKARCAVCGDIEFDNHDCLVNEADIYNLFPLVATGT